MFSKLFSSKKPVRRPQARITSRVVQDTFWVKSSQLSVGMYVSELDRPWDETRFMFQGFRIENARMLAAVQSECQSARVITEKLARMSTNSQHRLCAAARNKH